MAIVHRSYRETAWLVLALLLVSVLAPGVSRALAHARGDGVPWSAVCSADRPSPGTQRPPGGLASLLDPCAYCTLAGDSPAVPAKAAVGLALAKATDVLPGWAAQTPHEPRRWRASRARAPPSA